MDDVLKAIDILSSDDKSELNADILRKAKYDLEKEVRNLEVKKQCFDYEMDLKQKSFEASLKLLNMKWKILEEETIRLAEDKKKAEKRRAFFERVNSFEKEHVLERTPQVKNGTFFKGVKSKQGLKKRYRDLLKIYHPDSESGDVVTIQEINKEYALLKKMMTDQYYEEM